MARQATEESRSRGEIMRNAQRLVHIKGDGALKYANRMVEKLEERNVDEEERAFWKRIAAQVEMLLYEPPPE